MTPEVVSISMHSRIGIVVLAGTAFNTVFTPVSNADLLQNDFHMLIHPFVYSI